MSPRRWIVTGILIVACQPQYEQLEVRVAGEPRDGTVVAAEQFRVPVGTATAIRVAPIASGRRDYEPFHLVELRSRNESVLGVLEGPELDVFVLLGVAPGETTVDVSIRGRHVDEIPGEVIEQAGEP
jgi:hypothetical protein